MVSHAGLCHEPVQVIQERPHGPAEGCRPGGEIARQDVRVGKVVRHRDLFELEQGNLGVGAVVALRGGLEAFAPHRAKGGDEIRGIGQSLELTRILVHFLAEAVELLGCGHVQPASEQRTPAWLDGEVIAGARRHHGFPAAGSNVGAQVGFIRGFIFGEADVAVDARHALPGGQGLQSIGDPEFIDQFIGQALEGAAGGFIIGAVLVEPGFVVVLAQPGQEMQDRFQVRWGWHKRYLS